MGRTELVILITAAMIAALLAGWGLRWLFGRFNRTESTTPEAVDHLALRMQTAEQAAAHAEEARTETERAYLSQLRQAEAERDSAMEGLGTARRELAEWKRAYEALAAEKGQDG
ncbi:MAG: hypothetical protein AAGE18_12010 [Pseudomonadota bacterium]